MRKILLKELELSNWKALSIKASFGELSNRIEGCNKSGKSRMLNAWRWLLTGRVDVVHPINYELFDCTKELSNDTPEAVVRAVVDIDGCEYVIERRAKAKFTMGRGETTWVKASSDQYRMFVDNIEYPAKRFEDWLEEMVAPKGHLPYVIDGIFFTSLAEEDKGKARDILSALVGEIRSEDFTGEYPLIADMLVRYSEEEIIELKRREIKAVKERMTTIPILISSKENFISSMDVEDEDVINATIRSCQEQIDELDARILKSREGLSALIKEQTSAFDEMARISTEINERKEEYEKKYKHRWNEAKAVYADILARNEQADIHNNTLKEKRLADQRKVEDEKERLNGLLKEREELILRRDEAKALEFSDTLCTMCGQRLPDNMLEDAKRKFQERKESLINSIVEKGRKVREQINECHSIIDSLEVRISSACNFMEKEDTSLCELEIKKLEDNYVRFEDTSEYKELVDRKNAVYESIPEIYDANEETLLAERKGVEEKKESLLIELGRVRQIAKVKEEIAELRQELRDVSSVVARCQGCIDEAQMRIEERANIVSRRINSHLTDCSIQMWSTKKDGTKVPDCVILDRDGVKYGATNTAEKILIDNEIQRLFMKHYNVSMPIWVDEASVFNSDNLKFPNDCQSVYIFATNGERVKVSIV